MSADLTTAFAEVSIILGVTTGIAFWIKNALCNDMKDLRNSVIAHSKEDAEMWKKIAQDAKDDREKYGELLRLMLENHIDVVSQVARLDGKLDIHIKGGEKK